MTPSPSPEARAPTRSHIWSGRVLEGLLFGVAPRDPLTLILVTGVVALAVLLATYVPGRRAVRVDPVVALRAE